MRESSFYCLQQFYVIVGGMYKPGAVALKDAPLFVVLLSAAETVPEFCNTRKRIFCIFVQNISFFINNAVVAFSSENPGDRCLIKMGGSDIGRKRSYDIPRGCIEQVTAAAVFPQCPVKSEKCYIVVTEIDNLLSV